MDPAPSTSDSATPRTFGRYVLHQVIGRGGMGEVWRAFDPQLGREVALKLLRAGQIPARRAERFRREAQALAQLQHPHVIRIHDAGEAAGRAYLVMELVDGGSLQTRLAQRGPLAPRVAAGLILQLARALAVAHAAGILHRDVKPDNVLLRADGSPVLTDFGLALAEEDRRLTQTGAFVGTPGYLAPEQGSGARVTASDPRGDVYSLGATLYACLTGAPPHGQLSLLEQLAAAERRPQPPSRLARGGDAELDRICLACLEPNPAARTPSMPALAASLSAYLSGATSAGGRRTRTLAALVGGGGTLLGVGLLVALAGPAAAPPAALAPGTPSPDLEALELEASEPEAPEPVPAATASPAAVEVAWESARAAFKAGRRHADRGEHDAALVALNYAWDHAWELDEVQHFAMGRRLVQLLAEYEVAGPADVGPARARLARAREVAEELDRRLEQEFDPLQSMVSRAELGVVVDKYTSVQEARIAFAEGRLEEALQLARGVYERNRNSPFVVSTLLEVLERLGRDAELIQTVEVFESSFPDTAASAGSVLGLYYRALGRAGRGADQDALAERLLAVSDSGWYFERVQRRRARGPYDAARARLRELNAALEQAPSPALELERLRSSLLLEEFDAAKRYGARLLAKDPRNALALLTLGELYLAVGEPRQALDVLSRLLAVDPGHGLGHARRAEARLALGDYPESLRDARRALRLDPELARVTRVQAFEFECLFQLGRVRQADEVRRLLLDSGSPWHETFARVREP
ncbi:MAG: protein kinase [Planctomycetota bacterium]